MTGANVTTALTKYEKLLAMFLSCKVDLQELVVDLERSQAGHLGSMRNHAEAYARVERERDTAVAERVRGVLKLGIAKSKLEALRKERDAMAGVVAAAVAWKECPCVAPDCDDGVCHYSWVTEVAIDAYQAREAPTICDPRDDCPGHASPLPWARCPEDVFVVGPGGIVARRFEDTDEWHFDDEHIDGIIEACNNHKRLCEELEERRTEVDHIGSVVANVRRERDDLRAQLKGGEVHNEWMKRSNAKRAEYINRLGEDNDDLRAQLEAATSARGDVELPEFVERWRGHAAEGDHEALLNSLDMNVGGCVELGTMRACLEWLATAPAAQIAAATKGDAVVLEQWQMEVTNNAVATAPRHKALSHATITTPKPTMLVSGDGAAEAVETIRVLAKSDLPRLLSAQEQRTLQSVTLHDATELAAWLCEAPLPEQISPTWRAWWSCRPSVAKEGDCHAALPDVDDEQAADRAAVKALVDALPRCSWGRGSERPSCKRVGLLGGLGNFAAYYCDEHAGPTLPNLSYTPALRALLKRMEDWT